jgi:hypothetical protein
MGKPEYQTIQIVREKVILNAKIVKKELLTINLKYSNAYQVAIQYCRNPDPSLQNQTIIVFDNGLINIRSKICNLCGNYVSFSTCPHKTCSCGVF